MTSILVVEDDEAIRTALSRGLDERGTRSPRVGHRRWPPWSRCSASRPRRGAARPRAARRRRARADLDDPRRLATCRSSSSPPRTTTRRWSRPSTAAPTTTWSSRSGPTRSTPGSARCCGAAAADDAAGAGPGRRARDRRAQPARPRWPDEPLELARKEFDLLLALASRPGEVVTKRELLAEVWQQRVRRRPTAPSTCTCRGCGASSGSPPPSRATCTACAGSASGWSTRDARPALMRRRISWLVVGDHVDGRRRVRDPAVPAGPHARRGPRDGRRRPGGPQRRDPGRRPRTTTQRWRELVDGLDRRGAADHRRADRRRRACSAPATSTADDPEVHRARDGEAFTVVDDDGRPGAAAGGHRRGHGRRPHAASRRTTCAAGVTARLGRHHRAGRRCCWRWRSPSPRGSGAGSASRCSTWPASPTGSARATSPRARRGARHRGDRGAGPGAQRPGRTHHRAARRRSGPPSPTSPTGCARRSPRCASTPRR